MVMLGKKNNDELADWMSQRFGCTKNENYRGIFFIFSKIFDIGKIKKMIARAMVPSIKNPRAYFIKIGQNEPEYKKYVAMKKSKKHE